MRIDHSNRQVAPPITNLSRFTFAFEVHSERSSLSNSVGVIPLALISDAVVIRGRGESQNGRLLSADSNGADRAGFAGAMLLRGPRNTGREAESVCNSR